MPRFNTPTAISAATAAALFAIVIGTSAAARADDDWHGRHEWHEHEDQGEHRGWYKHHEHDGPAVYYAPPPIYVAPAPPPVVVAPAPVYVPPSVNVVVPLNFR